MISEYVAYIINSEGGEEKAYQIFYSQFCYFFVAFIVRRLCNVITLRLSLSCLVSKVKLHSHKKLP